jgi:hypothetical protein
MVAKVEPFGLPAWMFIAKTAKASRDKPRLIALLMLLDPPGADSLLEAIGTGENYSMLDTSQPI